MSQVVPQAPMPPSIRNPPFPGALAKESLMALSGLEVLATAAAAPAAAA